VKRWRTAFIPIIMLTAMNDTSSCARGFLAGTDDYIAKPFARAELLARMGRLPQRSYGAVLPRPVPPPAADDEQPTATSTSAPL
jgi:DNA-binding response OmpR family regulator